MPGDQCATGQVRVGKTFSQVGVGVVALQASVYATACQGGPSGEFLQQPGELLPTQSLQAMCSALACHPRGMASGRCGQAQPVLKSILGHWGGKLRGLGSAASASTCFRLLLHDRSSPLARLSAHGARAGEDGAPVMQDRGLTVAGWHEVSGRPRAVSDCPGSLRLNCMETSRAFWLTV